MKLDGMHHITMITGDAQRERRLLRRRPRPAAGQEDGQLRRAGGLPPVLRRRAGHARARSSPGSSSPARAAAAPGAGMIHTIQLGVAVRGGARLLGRAPRRQGLRGRAATSVADVRGLRRAALELVVADDGNPPLRAAHPEIPAEHAILGVEGARAYGALRHRRRPSAADRRRSASPSSATASTGSTAPSATSTGPTTPRAEPARLQGAGTVHHIAWDSRDEDHARVAAARRRGRRCT